MRRPSHLHWFLPLSLLAVCLFPVPLSATTFVSEDPRALAMGGAGVAGTRTRNAGLFNPAHLAGHTAVRGHRRGLAFYRPQEGVRVIDEEGFLQAAEDFLERDHETSLRDALEQLEEAIEDDTVELADLRRVTDEANDLLDGLESISGRPLRATASAGLNLNQPGERFGWGAHIRQRADAGSVIDISEQDVRFIRDTLGFVEALAEFYETDIIPPGVRVPRPVDELTSSATIQGASIRETGVSLAHDVPMLPDTRVGVTFKSLLVETVDWNVSVGDAERERFSRADQTQRDQDFNMDVGFTHKLEAEWTAGVMVRNVIGQHYQTVEGRPVRVRPVTRVGLAWEGDRLTVAWDADLVETPAIGFEPDRQYMGMGVEYAPWPWLALRGGVRMDRVSRQVTTGYGFGLVFERMHFDLSVGGDETDDQAVSLQLGARFGGQ